MPSSNRVTNLEKLGYSRFILRDEHEILAADEPSALLFAKGLGAITITHHASRGPAWHF